MQLLGEMGVMVHWYQEFLVTDKDVIVGWCDGVNDNIVGVNFGSLFWLPINELWISVGSNSKLKQLCKLTKSDGIIIHGEPDACEVELLSLHPPPFVIQLFKER